ncbi:MAG: type II toxin-antitoxin system prevent-host-death family antitoxin [Solirubrobacterales bacterium]|nr:type II toxin-antitoxin system prevent-host-death family antitoxin [Solirubrobacterales bacterium]
MTVIPQRTLRNDVADVLRRAEAGEQFTITVSGRPVAQLGPVVEDEDRDGPQRFVPAHVYNEMIASLPPDETLMDDLRKAGGGLVDPFE